jgi:lipopolysaccharide export system permease protein
MYRNLQNFIEWGAHLKVIVAYYTLLIPNALSIVLPVAFLISLVFCLNHLYHNNEIVALKVAGLKLMTITRVFWLVGACLTALLFFLNAHVTPWSLNKTKEIRQSALFSAQSKQRSRDDVGMLFSLTFDNQKAGRFWFINRFSEYTSRGFGVTLCILNTNGSEKKRMLAEEVAFDKNSHTWTFTRGKKIIFDPITGEVTKSIDFEKKVYKNLPENPRLMKNMTENIQNLSLIDIKEIINVSDTHLQNSQTIAYKIRYQNMLSEPFVCLLIVGLVIPFTLTGIRINPISSISKTAGLFATYYVLQAVGTLLGDQRTLPPLLAAWLPNITMGTLIFGLFKTYTGE